MQQSRQGLFEAIWSPADAESLAVGEFETEEAIDYCLVQGSDAVWSIEDLLYDAQESPQEIHLTELYTDDRQSTWRAGEQPAQQVHRIGPRQLWVLNVLGLPRFAVLLRPTVECPTAEGVLTALRDLAPHRPAARIARNAITLSSFAFDSRLPFAISPTNVGIQGDVLLRERRGRIVARFQSVTLGEHGIQLLFMVHASGVGISDLITTDDQTRVALAYMSPDDGVLYYTAEAARKLGAETIAWSPSGRPGQHELELDQVSSRVVSFAAARRAAR